MDPMIQSAWIAACAALVGVGGTVVVAIVTSRLAHKTNRETIKVTTDTTRATIAATLAGQIADLYSKAVEQLGSDKLDVRIGGIYGLERVARDSEKPKDHQVVMEVLTAFVREYSHEQWPESGEGRWTRPDIQAALTVIGRRDASRDDPDSPLDLYHAILIAANLNNANLRGAQLSRVNLTGAYLYDTDLVDADLRDAHFCDAHLQRPNLPLRPADLTGARWSGDNPPEGWQPSKGDDPRLERAPAGRAAGPT
jgi:hypothetical protein